VSLVLAQSNLPDDNAGYVAAAYLILFALVFAYFAIMAVKLARIERELVELNALADRREGAPAAGEPAAEAPRKVPAS
jgi:CcmD family protein